MKRNEEKDLLSFVLRRSPALEIRISIVDRILTSGVEPFSTSPLPCCTSTWWSSKMPITDSAEWVEGSPRDCSRIEPIRRWFRMCYSRRCVSSTRIWDRCDPLPSICKRIDCRNAPAIRSLSRRTSMSRRKHYFVNKRNLDEVLKMVSPTKHLSWEKQPE